MKCKITPKLPVTMLLLLSLTLFTNPNQSPATSLRHSPSPYDRHPPYQFTTLTLSALAWAAGSGGVSLRRSAGRRNRRTSTRHSTAAVSFRSRPRRSITRLILPSAARPRLTQLPIGGQGSVRRQEQKDRRQAGEGRTEWQSFPKTAAIMGVTLPPHPISLKKCITSLFDTCPDM